MTKARVVASLLTASMIAGPALAVPPPPPPDDALKIVQTFISATKDKDIGAYRGLLADTFSGLDQDLNRSVGRAAWVGEISQEFSNPNLRIAISEVFYTSHLSENDLVSKILIVENASNFSFGNSRSPDCCTFYRTETLTLGGGKIVRIDRSVSYDVRLSPTGARTDP